MNRIERIEHLIKKNEAQLEALRQNSDRLDTKALLLLTEQIRSFCVYLQTLKEENHDNA